MTQDDYNSRYIPNPDQKFKLMRYCKECGSKVSVSFPTRRLICTICREIDNYKEVYECNLCLEEHDQEECNCYEK